MNNININFGDISVGVPSEVLLNLDNIANLNLIKQLVQDAYKKQQDLCEGVERMRILVEEVNKCSGLNNPIERVVLVAMYEAGCRVNKV